MEPEHLDLDAIVERDQHVPQDLLHLYQNLSIKLVNVFQACLFDGWNLQLRNALLAPHQ
jgi:hypothetical protein